MSTLKADETVMMAKALPDKRAKQILIDTAKQQIDLGFRTVLMFAKQSDADNVREHLDAATYILQTLKGMV